MFLTLFLAALVIATAPSAQALAIATTLAAVLTAVSPLALRYITLDGTQKVAVTWVASLVIAIVADLVAGDLTLSWASVVTVLLGSGVVWSVQQAVFRLLVGTVPQAVYRVSRLRSADPRLRHT